MTPNNLSFKSEKLVVDYFEFKFDFLTEHTKQKIVEFFFKLGFNSFDIDKKYSQPIQTSIRHNFKNQYQIQFVRNVNNHWDGVCLDFPGNSAAFFYQLLKEEKIDWNLFDSATIHRFDLSYLRRIHPSQKRQVADFLKENETTINSKGINARIYSRPRQKELSLKIASKRSNRSAKIYVTGPKDEFLKFEMEIRRTLIAAYKPDFLSNNFQQIEDSLTREFLYYFWKLLHLKTQYTDWLSQKVRPIANTTGSIIVPDIYTDYIKSDHSKLSSISIKHFIMFLKFVRFTKKLNYDIQEFDQITYRIILFRVKDFSDECDSIFKSANNFYKIDQVKKFLLQLQQNIFVDIFNDSEFMQTLTFEHPFVDTDRLSGIHRITLFKQPSSKYLLARVVMMDDLFHYQYPFRFPNLFKGDLNKYQMLGRIKFIQIYSSKDVQKRFYIREFFKTYKISNQKRKYLKQIFIEIIFIFQKHQLIEDNVFLMPNQSETNIDGLTTSNISDGIILYEKFNTSL